MYGKTIEIAAHLGVHYATVSRRLNSWSDLSNIVALQGLTIEFLREFGGATKVFSGCPDDSVGTIEPGVL